MADFTLQVSGTSLSNWTDPASGGLPSRLNSRAGNAQKMRIGTHGVQLVLRAVVNGVVAPLDAALGGRLFTAWLVEAPALALPGTPVGDAAQSSVQRYTPPVAGHYTIGVERNGGGIELVHIEVA